MQFPPENLRMSHYHQKKKKSRSQLSTNSEALLCAAFQDKIMREWKIAKPKRNIHANPRKNLTFAQQIGVEDRPPSPLTDTEWQIAHQKSITRNDAQFGCSICCQDFKLKKQVILSCSHTFHHQCILSFERHSQTLCCPLCRSTDYEKRVIDDGAEYWKQRCCVMIQSVWRSFVVLKEYRIMQDTIEPTSPRKKERFLLRKFQRINHNVMTSMDQRANDIDAFLLSIDSNIAASRAVFDSFQCENLDHEQQGKEEKEKLTKDGKKWSEIRSVALKRQEKDCSICMELLDEEDCVLLSCSHVFHGDCIQSFERFALQRFKTCPICRAQEYERIEFKLD